MLQIHLNKAKQCPLVITSSAVSLFSLEFFISPAALAKVPEVPAVQSGKHKVRQSYGVDVLGQE